ncbi:glycoside hydrolase family 28 protein [Puteibacter caeruleilacunae]|nr:glycoside hydrolase family 28 protein [Puteibacter caeruleilacunae]
MTLKKVFKYQIFVLVVCMTLSCSVREKQNLLSVIEFGAIGDGTTLNSKAFQAAIDNMSKKGGGIVNVPSGKYLLGTILLKDNVTLNIEEGAEIIGSNHLEDYFNIDPFVDAVGQKRGNCLIGAKGARNIAITGKGWINGRGERMIYKEKGGRSKRPFMIRIVNCNGVKVSGIKLRNSAAWNIHLYKSKQIEISGVRILSQSEGNGDGIDIDSSEGVYIHDCDINAHDDAICFKSTSPVPCRDNKVENCRLSSRWGAIKFGTESMGNFENIEVANCYIYDTHGGGIKILSVDGSNIKKLNIHDIEMNDVEMPIMIRLGARLNTYRDAEKQPIGSIDGITIKNVKIHGKRWGKWRIIPASTMFITGLDDAKIKNVSIENIDALMYFAGKAEHAKKIVPEMRTRYPEYVYFDGHLPAYGAYIRHAVNISLNNISIRTVNEEQRHIIKAIDVNGLQIDGLKTKIDEGALTPISTKNVEGLDYGNIELSGNLTKEIIEEE